MNNYWGPPDEDASLSLLRSLSPSLPLSLPLDARISPLLSVPLSLCPAVAREFLGVKAKKYQKERGHAQRDRRCLKEGKQSQAESGERGEAESLPAPRAKACREGVHKSTRLEGAVSCKPVARYAQQVHTRKMPLGADVDLGDIARKAEGLSPAVAPSLFLSSPAHFLSLHVASLTPECMLVVGACV